MANGQREQIVVKILEALFGWLKRRKEAKKAEAEQK